QKIADDDGVRHRVRVLQQPRGVPPLVVDLLGLLVLLQVPDVPFVEGDVDLLVGAFLVPHVVGGRDDGVDEVVHVDRRGEEGPEVAVVLLVVRVAGDVVHVVVAVFEDGAFPVAEGRHGGAGGSADDEFEVLVGPLHRGGGAGGRLAVVVRRHEPGLPGAVHLVAEAPHAHVVRFRCAVGDAQVRQGRAGRVVGVLEEVQGGQDAPGG